MDVVIARNPARGPSRNLPAPIRDAGIAPRIGKRLTTPPTRTPGPGRLIVR